MCECPRPPFDLIAALSFVCQILLTALILRMNVTLPTDAEVAFGRTASAEERQANWDRRHFTRVHKPALQLLRRLSRCAPMVLVRYQLFKGLAAFADGQVGKAVALWKKVIAQSTELSLPFERASAMYYIATAHNDANIVSGCAFTFAFAYRMASACIPRRNADTNSEVRLDDALTLFAQFGMSSRIVALQAQNHSDDESALTAVNDTGAVDVRRSIDERPVFDESADGSLLQRAFAVPSISARCCRYGYEPPQRRRNERRRVSAAQYRPLSSAVRATDAIRFDILRTQIGRRETAVVGGRDGGSARTRSLTSHVRCLRSDERRDEPTDFGAIGAVQTSDVSGAVGAAVAVITSE